MINFSAWSIHRPLPAILAFVLLSGLGLYYFHRLPVTDFADVDFPLINVTVNYNGATPTQMEMEVTRKIEDAVAGVTGLEHIRSYVSQGNSTSSLEFDLDTDIQTALDDVRDAVTRIRSSLPQDINEPIVARQTLAQGNVATYAIESDTLGAAELSWLVDDTLSKQLRAVAGVGAVTRFGGVDREMRIDLQPDRLLAFGLSAAQVATQLRNTHSEQAGGRFTLGAGEQSIRILSTVNNPDALRAFPISLGDGRYVRLDELAKVQDRFEDVLSEVILNGRPVIGIQIKRVLKANEVEIAEQVDATIKQFAAENPTVKLTRVATNMTRIVKNYDSSMETLYEGALLAIIVVFLFLRDWRATYISAMALPLSIIPTFYVMSLFEIGLNTVSLLALSLVVGLLVDDAIVEVENIVRHLNQGKTPHRAALDAAQEIGLAVIGTSLTLVSIFVPVAFMPGVVGRFFKQFGITCAVAVIFSLLVARLITPMMAAYQLKAKPEPEHQSAFWNKYVNVVRWTLDHRGKTLLGALAIFIVAIAAFRTLPGSFLNAEDNGELEITVTMAPGSSLKTTRHATLQLQDLLLNQPEVQLVYSVVNVDTATVTAELGPRKERKRSQQEIQQAISPQFANIPGARISVGGRGFGQNLSVVLIGDDPELLNDTAARLESEMRGIGLSGINSSAALVKPEITITPDFATAAKLGITSATLSEAIRIGTSGDIDVRLPKLSLPARQIPIRVQLDPEALKSVDVLRALRIPARNGSVPLESVAKIELSSGPAQISRFDRHRNVSITVPLNGQALTTMLDRIQALPALHTLPTGVTQQKSGDLERQQQLTGGFAVAMITGVFCVYGVLALLFNDLLQPITILLALPLSIGGAVAALKLGGYGLAVSSYIGILMLMGIAVKNSILLVDYAVLGEERGLSRTDALLDACAKRARPIVMTSIAMGMGMLPTAFDLSGTSAFRAPMGMAVLGGLFTSTILSLLVIPAAYTYVADFEAWLRRLRHRFAG